jgi:ABC-type uncharacterized transport system involved in gliding motility auxiliary subunit
VEGIVADKHSAAAQHARFGATAGLYTLVVIAILAAVNYLGVRFNKSIDLTSNKRFTLSQETQKIVGNLKHDATITYFDEAKNFDQAKGILDRYKNLSSKIHVDYVNLRTQPMRAREYGVRFQGTAFVEEGQQREEAKSVDEQGITGAFIKLSKGIRKVCFVTGGKEHPLDQTDGLGLSAFKTLLERDNYQPAAITLIDKNAVPDDCKVTVVAGPKADYTPNEVSALKNYVESGGRALFLLDPPLDIRGEHISENTGLTNLLESWGVTLDKDLVLENTALVAIYGPENPPVNHYGDHPIVNELKGNYVIMPIVRSMEIKNAGKSTVSKLFSTSDNAVATYELTSGRVSIDDPKNKKGPFLLGAAGTYDTGKPNENGRFVVIGTSGFLANDIVSTALNRDLALNTINWLSSDEDLISIRPKEPEDRKLDPRSVGPIQYADFFAFPLLIIVAGIAVFMKRR